MRFDWAELLRLGLTRMGLKPHEFWALTPVELMLMLGPEARLRPMDKTGLQALLEAYPDATEVRKNEEHHE
ncbi:rcc01693 family protein [Lentibacter sp.]|uniref:rcc01693 family protein n=1 Tax=Lentibacter sp. TaxID=2024994 RepID=UPI003F6A04DA